MKILEYFRNRTPHGEGGDRGSAETSPPDGPALKTEAPTATIELAEAARWEHAQLREEARYRHDRLALYKARLYGGRPLREDKLRELQRAADGADARLRRAEARSAPARHPT